MRGEGGVKGLPQTRRADRTAKFQQSQIYFFQKYTSGVLNALL